MKEIKGIECKFVTFLPKIEGYREDTHLVKEVIHYIDGTTEPNLKIITNYQRPFYITKEHYRRHIQKKESEDYSKLTEYLSTQSDLPKECCKRLGLPPNKNTLRDATMSPYLYGVDVDARVLIKKEYEEKYPNLFTPYKVCGFDTEVNIENDDLIVMSAATSENIYVAILKDLVKNYPDPVKQINYIYKKYAPDTELTKNINITIEVFDKEIDLIKNTFKHIHSWKPDFLTAWNIDFDVKVMLRILEENSVKPEDIFSDPSLPLEYRYFKYQEDRASKMTASGANKPPGPQERWHKVTASSSFYWIDAMCGYNYVRVGSKIVPGGYGLDNILNKELGDKYKKLKFEEDIKEHLTGVDYHKYMVNNKPLEYVVYNMWDVLSMLELDKKTKDLEVSIPVLAGYSSFDIFKSGPKRIVDALYFFYKDRNMCLGCKSPIVEENNEISLSNWINMLPAYRVMDGGRGVIEENEDLITNVFRSTIDADKVKINKPYLH